MYEITVCIPTFNKANILLETLNSLARQTQQIANVVVLDDCSTDNTEQLVKQFQGVRYIKNKANLGMPENWNEAFRTCKTKYLTILQDDDLLDRKWHETWLPIVNSITDCGIYFSRVALITNSHQTISEGYLYRSKRYATGAIYKDLMKARMFGIPVSGATIYNLDLLSGMSKFLAEYDNHVNIYPDLDFHNRVAKKFPIYYSDKRLAYSRREYVPSKSKELHVTSTVDYYRAYIRTVIPHYCWMYEEHPDYVKHIWLHFLFVSIILSMKFQDNSFLQNIFRIKRNNNISPNYLHLPAIWLRDLCKYSKYTILKLLHRHNNQIL